MTKMNEDDKYSKLYGSNYGGEGNRRFERIDYVERFVKLDGKSIVDFGCGPGFLRTRIKHKSYLGIDIARVLADRAKSWAENEAFLHRDIRSVSLLEKRDVAVSFDVLEHIPEEDVDRVIRNMLDSADDVIIGIACTTALTESPDEDNLHRTVRPPLWWKDRIELQKKVSHMHIEHDNTYVTFIITDKEVSFQGKVPDQIMGMRLRKSGNGSVYIARQNRAVENILDATMIRVPNTLRWYMKYRGPHVPMTDKIYVVGKGPSLDFLSEEDFDGDSSVLCINDSINKVASLNITNPLFCVQQDHNLGNRCKIEGVTYLLNPHLKTSYKTIPNCHFIEPMSVGAMTQVSTGVFAVCVAKNFGVKSFRMMCFDASALKIIGYAKCIGYAPEYFGNKDPNRFLAHRKWINIALADSPTEWFTPIDRSCTTSDKPQE